MTDLYLIAHKVRGEPAFDIAIQMQCPLCSDPPKEDCTECEDLHYWWIIPTSGHRAYPFWQRQLKQGEWPPQVNDIPDGPLNLHPGFDNVPDHYEADLDRTVILSHDVAEGEDLLAQLGLRRPKEPIRRRI